MSSDSYQILILIHFTQYINDLTSVPESRQKNVFKLEPKMRYYVNKIKEMGYAKAYYSSRREWHND